MAKLVLPVTHYIKAKYGRNRTAKMLKITEGVAFDIDEVSSGEATIVASMNKPWPVSGKPGQWVSTERNDDRFNQGAFDLRQKDGEFYAPVRRFSKIEAIKSESVTVDDLKNIDSYSFYFASPFDPTLNFDTSPVNIFEGQRYCEGEGYNGSWEELNVRDIDGTHDHRANSIESMKQNLNLILIEGDLHLKVSQEPRIRFMAFDYEVFVSVVDGGYSSKPPKGGFFKMNRLEDCLEHIAATYPDLPVHQAVKNVRIYDETCFKYADEEEALLNAGWDTFNKLARFGSLLNQNDEIRGIFFKMDQVNFNRLDDAGREKLCDRLEELTKHDIGAFGLETEEIKAAVQRWRIRPVDRKPVI